MFATETDPTSLRWFKQRAELSRQTGRNQRRLLVVHMYTDDPCFACVGAERLALALRV